MVFFFCLIKLMHRQFLFLQFGEKCYSVHFINWSMTDFSPWCVTSYTSRKKRCISVKHGMFEVELHSLEKSLENLKKSLVSFFRAIFAKLMAHFILLLSGMYKYLECKNSPTNYSQYLYQAWINTILAPKYYISTTTV